MKKLMFLTTLCLAMGIVMMLAPAALAQQPTQAEIVAAKATYTGTLKRADGGADVPCTVTVIGEGQLQADCFGRTFTYTGKMGPAGAKAGNPITMNGTGPDQSEARFQWKTLDDLQVEWWVNMAAKAGQTQNKPAQIIGVIRRVNQAVSGSEQNCVPGDGEIAFFADTNFQGNCKVLKIGDYADVTKVGITDDSISSWKVGKNIQLKACKDNNFQGDCEYYLEDLDEFKGGFINDNTISSLKISSICSPNKLGSPIQINWVNKWDTKIRLIPVDSKCEEDFEKNTDIEPGKAFIQKSYDGQVFRMYYYTKDGDEKMFQPYNYITVSPSTKNLNIDGN